MRIAMSTSSKSIGSCSEDDNELRRGPWTLEEDTVLIQYISSHGEGRWNLLAKRSGLRRTGKSCRLRWLNYLKPDVKRGNLSPQEQFLILELHSKWGNRWARIAQHLPGRTDNEIKNYWRTRLQKQARYLKAKEASSSLQGQAFALPLDSVSQDSMIETTETQILREEACMNEAFLNSSYEYEQNSYSEHNNSSYMSSSESANIPKVPQHLGYSNSSCQFHALDNNDFSTFAHDEYFVTNNGCETETFNLAESSWVNEEFACNMWNMDELWQFRNLQK